MHRGLSRLVIVFAAIFVLAFAMAIGLRRNTSIETPAAEDASSDEDAAADGPALAPESVRLPADTSARERAPADQAAPRQAWLADRAAFDATPTHD